VLDSRASFTAETVALRRAFESKRPVGSRLFVDPYADAFLRPSLRTLAVAGGLPGVRRLASGLYDAVAGPGPRPSAIVRTKVGQPDPLQGLRQLVGDRHLLAGSRVRMPVPEAVDAEFHPPMVPLPSRGGWVDWVGCRTQQTSR
jgi:hypothetical protein